MMLLLLLLGVAAAEYRAMTPLFAQFMETHGKEYSSAAEHNKRFWIFYKNTELWNRANKEDRGTAVYGPTKFADLTPEEFSDIYLNKVMASSDISEVRALHPEILMDVDPSDIPSSVDWREHNAVTEVKNQGMCGSCWAFSTTGNVEGQYAIKTGNLSSFSEQELVDCDTVDNGCNGGLPSQAYLEIKRLGGLESEEEYPYKGTGGTCKLDKSKVRVDVTGGITLPQDEEQIAAWVAQNGPVSIGINAFMMQFYMGGIAHPYWFMCRPGKLDHGVLITGYGEEDGTPYWNIKNSWGTTWGEKGYYRIYRGGDCCGVDRMVTSATL